MTAWNKILIAKAELEKYYTKDHLSLSQIAKKYHLSTGPIHRLLREYKIPIRSLSVADTKIDITKRQLVDMYCKQKLSMNEIAEKFNCSHGAIVYKFKKYNIKSRGKLGLRKSILTTRETLEKLYTKGYSLEKIAKMCHKSKGGIERKFNEYNIPTRGHKNRTQKIKKKDFSKDLVEKAYLIGFRSGDLNVKQRISVIQVRCSSTVQQQVVLFKKLFNNYTKIKISPVKKFRENGDLLMGWGMVALLNKSFKFLIPKTIHIPRWITSNKQFFFSYVAGYIDAEGCFYLKKPKKDHYTESGGFEVQTQQKEIILGIWRGLKKHGIKIPKPYISVSAGRVRPNGVRNNKDMWRIDINRKNELFQLINETRQYIKHPNKLVKLKEVEKNLILRGVNIPHLPLA